jgi:polyisoprenoid-binding protein YceI
MRRIVLFSALLAFTTQLALAQTSAWIPDKAHSEVSFSILHMTLSNVHGRFGNICGAIHWDGSDISKSTVKVTIDMSSVDTGEGARDSELKSPSFFGIDKFPTATFVSTGVSRGANGLAVNGNLTLHGVTKPVVLEVDGPNGPVTGMDQKPHVGFSATTTISRTTFGIGASYPAAIVGDEVKLSIDLEAVKQ